MGKEFSSKGILERLRQDDNGELPTNSLKHTRKVSEGVRGTEQYEFNQEQKMTFAKELGKGAQNILEQLMKQEKAESETPSWLFEKKRQKKKSRGLRF